jgi:CBS domain-containing membrane protein
MEKQNATMIKSILYRFKPAANTVNPREQLRACSGAIFGLLLAGLLSQLAGAQYGNDGGTGYLIAPMGASAVLLFCLPGSPLAQPWSVVGGNMISGLIGIACLRLMGDAVAVAALAGAIAIGTMFLLRCLHPPGGAVALTVVLGGPAVHAAGYGFVLAPIGLNSLLLVCAAMLFNNLTGRRYPHAQQPVRVNPHATADVITTSRLGFTAQDLDLVLQRHNRVLDVSRDDLEQIMLQTEMQAYQRRFGVITCVEIMSKDVLTAQFATELPVAWRQLMAHSIVALPVLNQARRVIGIVTQSDFLRHSGAKDYASIGSSLQRFLRRSGMTHCEKAEVVGQIMTPHPRTAQGTTPIIDLVPLMADSGFHHIPIVDGDARFVGIVTQSDLVAALYRSRYAEINEPVALRA